jgi:hypothetical protein
VIPGLGSLPSEPTPESTPRTKFVDEAPPAQGFCHRHQFPDAGDWRAIWLRPEPAASVLANAGFLGSRKRRQSLWTDVSRDAIERGHELAQQHNDAAFRASRLALSDIDPADAAAARHVEELAELDGEEAGRPGPLDLR